MTENSLQLATKNWIEAVQNYYENNSELTQIYMRGYFAGWSEREILRLAERLLKNEQDYPLWRDKENK
jgi:hypothetical protein